MRASYVVYFPPFVFTTTTHTHTHFHTIIIPVLLRVLLVRKRRPHSHKLLPSSIFNSFGTQDESYRHTTLYICCLGVKGRFECLCSSLSALPSSIRAGVSLFFYFLNPTTRVRTHILPRREVRPKAGEGQLKSVAVTLSFPHAALGLY